MELVVISDGQVDEAKLVHCLNAYQSTTKYLTERYGTLPAVIKLALLEKYPQNLREDKKDQVQWNKADNIIEKLLGNNGLDEEIITKKLQSMMIEEKVDISFIEHLSYRLRDAGIKIYDNIEIYK